LACDLRGARRRASTPDDGDGRALARKGVAPRRPERESICHRAPFARWAH
jgi:hypothetical protein